jgi:hypothetical protein
MSNLALPQGFSDAAGIVAHATHRNYKRLADSVTFSKQSAYEALWDVWQACKVVNWDGYGALAVDQETYHNAYCLIEALPLGYPLPSVGAEPDGHLTLEWYRHPNWTLSVSIAPEGTLYYAALLGTEDPRGSCPFYGEIPESLLYLIRRVVRT